ncbi:MAG: sigma-70 family RNA polymerase sigma factor [Prevotella sp.]|nr:sigma-70 family RNA polymerase sigma factor [Prevotella sp.]
MTQETFQDEAKRLRPTLTAVAERYSDNAADAEDIVQDVLLKLWLMHDDLRSPADGLAIMMTRNLSIDHQRRRKPQRPTLDIPEEEHEEDERIDRMMQLIDTLPPMQQIILRFRHLDGMEYSEIAHITSSTETAVRKMISRARKEILLKLKK